LLTALPRWLLLVYDPNPAIHPTRPGLTNSALLVPCESAGDKRLEPMPRMARGIIVMWL
jgi:hypothetical protein